MKRRLKRRFITIAMISFLAVITFVVAALNIVVSINFQNALDETITLLAENNGTFPMFTPPDETEEPEFSLLSFTFEYRKANRFFVVFYDQDKTYVSTNLDHMMQMDEEDAVLYGNEILSLSDTHNTYESYRYQVVETEDGYMVIMVDGSLFEYSKQSFLFISILIALISSIIVLIVVSILSEKAIQPIILSHERQKQFITDVSHELKTPLTIISAQTDLILIDDQKNEWAQGIKKQTHRLTELTEQLIDMSKLDELIIPNIRENIHLSELISDIWNQYIPMFQTRNIRYHDVIGSNIHFNGDTKAIKTLMLILLDNALKYVDEQGQVNLYLKKGKSIEIILENSFYNIDLIDTQKIFDRFYRGDPSRTAQGSYGLGLSIAKKIVELHEGHITAMNQQQRAIRFIIKFKG